MTHQLSDFESCLSSSSGDDDVAEVVNDNEGFQTTYERQKEVREHNSKQRILSEKAKPESQSRVLARIFLFENCTTDLLLF